MGCLVAGDHHGHDRRNHGAVARVLDARDGGGRRRLRLGVVGFHGLHRAYKAAAGGPRMTAAALTTSQL